MVLRVNQIAPIGTGSIITESGNLLVSPGGNLVVNLESEFGVYTTGLLLVRGNENGLNGTMFMWTWNITYHGPSDTRYVQLNRITDADNILGNAWGEVYAYVPAFAADYKNPLQSTSSTAPSVSDIYFRSGTGNFAGCAYTIWRTG